MGIEKSLLGTLASHGRVLVQVLAPVTLIQLPINVSEQQQIMCQALGFLASL